MDESTIKAMKLRDESDEVIRKPWVVRGVSVEGFENCRLQRYAVELALCKHFASCGTILNVVVLKSLAYITFEGEGVQDKALELDGTDVGGWTAIVKPNMWPGDVNYPYTVGIRWSCVCVRGYDTGLPQIDIKIALCEHFSSCGEVAQVEFITSDRACITIEEGCVDKALELNGSKMGEMNLVVYTMARTEPIRKSRRLTKPNTCGYVLGSCTREEAKRKKMKMKMKMKMEKEMEIEMEMEMEMEMEKGMMKMMEKEKEMMKMMEKIEMMK